MEPSHYELLGVDRGASQEEVAAAWRIVARRLHPDRHVNKPAVDQRAATQAFAAASAANNCLSDPRQRREYDKTLRLRGAKCSACGGEGRTYRQQGPLRRIAIPCPACRGNGFIERRAG